jgi:serine/threonine-protein kinase
MPAADAPLPEVPTQEASLVGRRVGKYEIVRVIGRGGMGTVYEALNTSIGKRVAMKFVDAELSRNKDAVARFQREAQAASAVESAHIVEIFDAGTTDDGLPYLVMELLRGEDLGHRIKRCGRLDLPEALHVTSYILRGLHRAHEAGIVHRDLKPDNIFLVDRDDDGDFVKLLDFGISKMRRTGVPEKTITRQGTVLGTPYYMSPEQAQALPDIDERTDLWSVGAILYECLTGRPPHQGHSYEQVIINICTTDAPDVRMHNPGVPEPIARVLTKALTRQRDARFASAREFLEALSAASGGLLPARASLRSSAGDPLATPGAQSRTPLRMTPTEPASPEPAIDAGRGGPSRVGWSTSGRENAGPRRSVIMAMSAVAVVAAAAGGVAVGRRAGASARAEGATLAEPGPRIMPSFAPTANEARPAEPATSTPPADQTPPQDKPGAAATTAPNKPVNTAKTTLKPATSAPTAKPAHSSKPSGVAPQLQLKSE